MLLGQMTSQRINVISIWTMKMYCLPDNCLIIHDIFVTFFVHDFFLIQQEPITAIKKAMMRDNLDSIEKV